MMEMPDVIYARFIPERRNNSGTWSVFEKPHCKWGPTTRTVKVDHERQKYHHSRVVEALQKESEENCRLLGMSAERELALLAFGSGLTWSSGPLGFRASDTRLRRMR